jgi:hypothetical protein
MLVWKCEALRRLFFEIGLEACLLPFLRKSLIAMIIPGNSALFFEECFRAERGQGAKHLKKTKPECVLIQPNSGGFRWIQVNSTKSKIKNAQEEPFLAAHDYFSVIGMTAVSGYSPDDEGLATRICRGMPGSRSK